MRNKDRARRVKRAGGKGVSALNRVVDVASLTKWQVMRMFSLSTITGTCHLPLQEFNHVPLQPLKGVQGGEHRRGTPSVLQEKLTEQVFR